MIRSRLKNKAYKSKNPSNIFKWQRNKNSYIQENIMLLEKNKLLSKQKDVAAVFNKHFGSMTDSLNHFSWPEETWISPANDTVNSISGTFVFRRS